MEYLRGLQCDLVLMMQPVSPETLENHTLFGETESLGEVGKGQSSVWRWHKKGMEGGVRQDCVGGSGFIHTRK